MIYFKLKSCIQHNKIFAGGHISPIGVAYKGNGSFWETIFISWQLCLVKLKSTSVICLEYLPKRGRPFIYYPLNHNLSYGAGADRSCHCMGGDTPCTGPQSITGHMSFTDTLTPSGKWHFGIHLMCRFLGFLLFRRKLETNTDTAPP